MLKSENVYGCHFVEGNCYNCVCVYVLGSAVIRVFVSMSVLLWFLGMLKW